MQKKQLYHLEKKLEDSFDAITAHALLKSLLTTICKDFKLLISIITIRFRCWQFLFQFFPKVINRFVSKTIHIYFITYVHLHGIGWYCIVLVW